jgi:geranylgeranyl reductase family protein
MSYSFDQDVIVAGAGPAGSMAAIHLAQQGCRVLVLEKKAFPRTKPCGGCLSKRVENLLPPSLLRSVIEEEITRVHFTFRSQETWSYASSQPAAYMVRREVLDTLLAREAEKMGARVLYQTPLVQYRAFSDRVEIATREASFSSSYLILAHGAYDLLSGPFRFPGSSLTYQALEGRFAGSLPRHSWPNQTVAIHLGHVSFGYGWTFPYSRTLSVGISFLPQREKHSRKQLQKFKKSLPLQEALPKLKGHPIPCYDGRSRPYSQGRVLRAGDAACLVEPFLGEGIYYALQSGRMAARHILQASKTGSADLTSYDQDISRSLLPDFAYALRLAKWVYAFPGLFWWLLKRHPVIMDIYFDILRGRESYERFFWELRKRIRVHKGLTRILGEPPRHAFF